MAEQKYRFLHADMEKLVVNAYSERVHEKGGELKRWKLSFLN